MKNKTLGSENAKAPAAKEPTLDELLKMAGTQLCQLLWWIT